MHLAGFMEWNQQIGMINIHRTHIEYEPKIGNYFLFYEGRSSSIQYFLLRISPTEYKVDFLVYNYKGILIDKICISGLKELDNILGYKNIVRPPQKIASNLKRYVSRVERINSSKLTKEAVIQYGERNKIIYKLGFASYTDYLRSDLWKEVRGRVLKRRYGCKICPKIANQVHHIYYTYENLSGKSLNGLWSLCAECHVACEFNSNNEKLSPEESYLVLLERKKIFA